MPDGSKLADRIPRRFHADRKVGGQEAFVARFLPTPTAETRPRPMSEPPSGPGGTGVPTGAPGPSLVAADLRSARARQRPAEVSALPETLAPRVAEEPQPGRTADVERMPSPVADLPLALDPADLERQLANARNAGREEGRAEMAAQLDAERTGLARAAQALASALARLERPSDDQVAVLAQAIDAAVLRLATERAGVAIDHAPAGFALRVARLAERLAAHPGGTTVRLHPDDLAAVLPVLTGAVAHDLSCLAAARLVGDPGLQRGDADLQTAEIRIADLIDPPSGDAE